MSTRYCWKNPSEVFFFCFTFYLVDLWRLSRGMYFGKWLGCQSLKQCQKNYLIKRNRIMFCVWGFSQSSFTRYNTMKIFEKKNTKILTILQYHFNVSLGCPDIPQRYIHNSTPLCLSLSWFWGGYHFYWREEDLAISGNFWGRWRGQPFSDISGKGGGGLNTPNFDWTHMWTASNSHSP